MGIATLNPTTGIATINPATGEVLRVFDPLTSEAIDRKINIAAEAFDHYRRTDFAQRSQWLQAAARILLDRKQEFAEIMTLEMGKPVTAAIAEVEKCAAVCQYYAENAAQFLADHPVAADAGRSFVKYQPMGIILAVMPWNFPFWQVFRFAAPTLMAGNVGLLKHASNVPQSALAIEEILMEAGFPTGTFQTLLIRASQVAQVMEDDRVMAATLTGSEAAGMSLASTAGKQLKKTVLELGGSDPFIVMESADLATAVATAATARMLNNGQSCIAAKRFIVQESIADQFARQLVEKFAALRMGNPLEPDVQVGPLATPQILEELHAQVQACINVGAKVLIGGNPDQVPTKAIAALQPGNFYPPTILADHPPESPAYQEEFFGPVALLFRVTNLDEAIQLANSTAFGLGASAWTNHPDEIDRCINELEAGAVFINSMVKSDPRLPFGGIKRSGYGRELGIEGIREFVNVKTVYVK